jgi:hypothetical protein
MAVTLRRVHTRFSSAKRLLLVAGVGSIVVATAGIVLGRSSTLCCVFVVVGCAVIGASAIATYGREQSLPLLAGFATLRPVPGAVVIDDDDVFALRGTDASRRLARRDRDTHRAHPQLVSATLLALLLVAASVLVLFATLAVLFVVLLLLGGH